jgi:uncharacterized phage protein (TIGR02216 family)
VLDCGLHLLRLPPTIFWALTPIEFSIMAYGAQAPRQAFKRHVLDGLMQEFPDNLDH